MKTMPMVLAGLVMMVFAGCATAPQKLTEKRKLSDDVQVAVAKFKAKDPSIEKFFQYSAGYAVLPKVFKAAFIGGGAYGKGEVFDKTGRKIGYCDISQGTLGLSIGGEFFREILFFERTHDFNMFQQQEFTLSAQATAVAIKAGAAAKTDYRNGIAVFLMTDAGLMVDASVGGQQFGFEPLE